IESQWLQPRGHLFCLLLRKGNVVRETAHEGNPPPVRAHIGLVACQHCALTTGPARPAKHLGALEVASKAEQAEAPGRIQRYTRPCPEHRSRAHDRTPIVLVDPDRHTTESVAPLHHSGVEVGM